MRKLAVALAVLAAMLLLAAGILILTTFPGRDGRRQVAGLRAPVSIETDGHGVPRIRAASVDDAFFGLGWAHARDRLWQMELQRRIGAGRLSEVLGARAVKSDQFLRTIGFRRAAEEALRSLSPEARGTIRSYRDGVNAYVKRAKGLPVEFRILRIAPAAFDEADCLVWSKLMAWDLSGNAAGEIRRMRLEARMGAQRANELFPPAPSTPTILGDGEWRMPAPAGPTATRASSSRTPAAWSLPGSRKGADAVEPPSLLDALAFGGEAVGSNAWVVAGSRTTTGRPILANDPHLGLRTPSIWYLARLEAPGLDVAGATLPGLPGVVIGHNARIAWGLTNLEPDVQDLFLERPDPADRARYLWRGRSLPFERRLETIRVRGGADVRLDVRSSVHGPIVTDVLAGAEKLGSPVALRWTGLDPGDRTGEAFLAVDRAADWPAFLAAVSLLHCPAQNFVYADADGHVGYTSSGALPIRPRSDGVRPAAGDGGDDWLGSIPFEELPRVLDPERGYVVTANNRVVSELYPHPFSRDWPEPYRARRIEDLILAAPKLSPDDMRAIALDRVSYQARDVVPLLLDTRPLDAESRDALGRLRDWKFEMSPASVPAAIYAAWYAALSSMPEDELGEPSAPSVRSRFVMEALRHEAPWCDDVSTPRRETCADFKSAALARAVSLLRRRLGGDPAGWRWERLHRARFPHGAFDTVPVLSKLFSLESGQGGDGSTVNVGAYRRDGSFRMSDGPSYRQLIDFSDLSASRYVHTTGQSGNPFEKGYRDLLPMWREGRDFRMGDAPLQVELLEPSDGAEP